MDRERRRRVQQLVAGIVVSAVVIGLCVAALVVLFDRFTAHVGDDCPASGCVTRHYSCNGDGRAAAADLVAVVRREAAVARVKAGRCESGSAGIAFALPGTVDQASRVVRRAWDCDRKKKPRTDRAGGRYFLCSSGGVRFDLDLARGPGAGGPEVAVEARPVR
jgi:hypothetical protein